MKEEQPKTIHIVGVLATLTSFILLLVLAAFSLVDNDWAVFIGASVIVIILGIVYAFVNEFRDKWKDSASE